MSVSEEIISSSCYSTVQVDRIESLLFVERNGEFGGYKFDLLKEEYPAAFFSLVKCSRCEGIMRDASGVGSPQVFMCSVCVEGMSHSALGPNREAVGNLIIWCPLKSRGCEWEGHISSSETHLDTCQYFHIECHMSCGTVVRRIDVESHMSGECPFREIMCEHCTQSLKQTDMNLHLRECVLFPIHCTNGCGDILKRGDMQSHREELCPNSLLVCGYKKYGCGVKPMRKDLKTHTTDYIQQHIEMRLEVLELKMETEQSEFRDDDSLKNELTTKSREIKSIQTQLNSVIVENTNLKRNILQLTAETELLSKKLDFTGDIPKIEGWLLSKMKEHAGYSEKITFFVNKMNDILHKKKVAVVHEFNKKMETIGTLSFKILCEESSSLVELKCYLIIPIGSQLIFETNCTLVNQLNKSTNASYKDTFTIRNKQPILETTASARINDECEHKCVIHKIPKSLLNEPGILCSDSILFLFFFNIKFEQKEK